MRLIIETSCKKWLCWQSEALREACPLRFESHGQTWLQSGGMEILHLRSAVAEEKCTLESFDCRLGLLARMIQLFTFAVLMVPDLPICCPSLPVFHDRGTPLKAVPMFPSFCSETLDAYAYQGEVKICRVNFLVLQFRSPPATPQPLPSHSPVTPQPLPSDSPATPRPLLSHSPATPQPLPGHSPATPRPLPSHSPTTPRPLPSHSPATPEPVVHRPDWSLPLPCPCAQQLAAMGMAGGLPAGWGMQDMQNAAAQAAAMYQRQAAAGGTAAGASTYTFDPTSASQ